jgi:hypothetical protein
MLTALSLLVFSSLTSSLDITALYFFGAYGLGMPGGRNQMSSARTSGSGWAC